MHLSAIYLIVGLISGMALVPIVATLYVYQLKRTRRFVSQEDNEINEKTER